MSVRTGANRSVDPHHADLFVEIRINITGEQCRAAGETVDGSGNAGRPVDGFCLAVVVRKSLIFGIQTDDTSSFQQ